MDELVLEVKDLKVQFNERKIFENINLTLHKGEVLSIIGKSGVGKTTLLRCIAGLNKYEGKIHIHYNQSDVILVTQFPALWTNLTVLDNLSIVRRILLNESLTQARKNSITYLEQLEVENLKKKFPSTLSGGEQQRVNFARALAAEKKIYLLDEITSNIDLSRRGIVIQIIKVLAKEGISFIFSSHDIDTTKMIEGEILELQQNGFSKI